MKKLLAVASALALTVSAVSPAVLAAETLATQQTETSARENMQKILEYPNKTLSLGEKYYTGKTIELKFRVSAVNFRAEQRNSTAKKFITLHGMKKTETRVLI